LGKPFELAGLFGAADAGAFGGGSDEVTMDEAEQNAEKMDEDE
jgi:nuclear GTP-binding protein